MTRLYEAAALAYGIATLALLTGIAMWFGDAFAVRMMVGSIVSAYVCQAFAALHDTGHEQAGYPSLVAWIGSIGFGAAAIWSMAL